MVLKYILILFILMIVLYQLTIAHKEHFIGKFIGKVTGTVTDAVTDAVTEDEVKVSIEDISGFDKILSLNGRIESLKDTYLNKVSTIENILRSIKETDEHVLEKRLDRIYREKGEQRLKDDGLIVYEDIKSSLCGENDGDQVISISPLVNDSGKSLVIDRYNEYKDSKDVNKSLCHSKKKQTIEEITGKLENLITQLNYTLNGC